MKDSRSKGLIAIPEKQTVQYYYKPTDSTNTTHVASYDPVNGIITFTCVGFEQSPTTLKCIKSILTDILKPDIAICKRKKGIIYFNALQIPFNQPVTLFESESDVRV